MFPAGSSGRSRELPERFLPGPSLCARLRPDLPELDPPLGFGVQHRGQDQMRIHFSPFLNNRENYFHSVSLSWAAASRRPQRTAEVILNDEKHLRVRRMRQHFSVRVQRQSPRNAADPIRQIIGDLERILS